MKYPKLAAAIDEFLAKVVKEHAEDALEFVLASAMTEQIYPPEKLPDIPVMKEIVLSHQEEVRDGD